MSTNPANIAEIDGPDRSSSIGVSNPPTSEVRPLIPPYNPRDYICDDPLPIPLPPHHTVYEEPMATMIAELHAVADTTLVPTYTDPLVLSQAM